MSRPKPLIDTTEFPYEVQKNQNPDHIRFSEHLAIIQSKLPSWMKMKKDRRTQGALFLNVIGLELDDVKFILEYAFKQTHIQTASLTQTYEVFKATIPSIVIKDNIINVRGDVYELEEADNMIDFLTGLSDDGLAYKEVFYNNPYYIDWDKRTIYVRKPYEESKEHPEGMISIEVHQANGLHIGTYPLTLSYHHVWNFFDEFGYLLNTPRLYRENNKDYKRRILDVFRHPANSGETGLRNGVARELNLIRYETWKDTSNPLFLKHQRIDINTIEVNGEAIGIENITYTRRGRLAIEPMGIAPDAEVSYVAGVHIHELHDKSDYEFQNELFTAEGTATPKLEHYVRQITDQVPIFWGHFKWDEGFWDIASEDMSGYGYVPSFADATIAGWENYKKNKGDK